MKFFHLRVGKDGVYHRARTPEKELAPRGGMTIGYVKVNPDGRKLLMTFSRCSEKDLFNRKRGLQVCLGRFAKGKYIEVERPEDQDIYELLLQNALKREKEIETERKKLGIKIGK